MRYSGSRFVREISARLSEKEDRYHGPGKAERGCRNWVWMMRTARAARTRSGRRPAACEIDGGNSSMVRISIARLSTSGYQGKWKREVEIQKSGSRNQEDYMLLAEIALNTSNIVPSHYLSTGQSTDVWVTACSR